MLFRSRGYSKFLGLEYLKYRLGAKRAIIRPKIGTLRAKWLQELKQEEDIVILLRFKERYLKSCCEAAIKQYFRKDKPIILI